MPLGFLPTPTLPIEKREFGRLGRLGRVGVGKKPEPNFLLFLQGTNIGDLMIQWVELNSIIRAIFQCGVAFPQILTLPSNMLTEKLTFSREDIFGNLMITACEWSTPCPKELELIGCNVLNQMI